MNANRRRTTVDTSHSDRHRADILAVVRAMAPTPPDRLRDDHRLVDDLGFDSVRLIELAIALEEYLGLPRTDLDEAVTVSTVGDVIAMIGRIRSRVTR
jgi:acyl carrier protein